MVDEEKQVNEMTRRIQQAILPIIAEADSAIAVPAILQVAISMATFVLDCSPIDAVDSIIATLEDMKRARTN